MWGRPPRFIEAEYEVVDGVTGERSRKKSLLLASGFWGVARHFQYFFELTAAWTWCLLANPAQNGVVPLWCVRARCARERASERACASATRRASVRVTVRCCSVCVRLRCGLCGASGASGASERGGERGERGVIAHDARVRAYAP